MFELALNICNIPETRDENMVFSTACDLNTCEHFIRVIEGQTNGRKVES